MNEQPDSNNHSSTLGIAIVGMTGRFPGARNLEAFWQNLRDGVESIRFPDGRELESLGVPPALLRDPNYVKAAAVLDGMQLFDAAFFGYTPREAELLDPQQRVFLECAWEALENAGYDPATCRETVGVFAGATTNTYILFNLLPNRHLLGTLDPVQVDVSSSADFLATRVSYKLNLKGPGYTVQTACSTSLLAVHLACQSLLNEECDLALAGGVAINVKHPEGYQYVEGGIVSPDGHCRAFDAGANGTIFGSGVGVVVLKRLEDALAQGDTIHAVILGSAINNDGSDKVGYTAPGVNGQADVITEALAVAGVEADGISYVEAHGTGTQMGDPIEIRALTKAFRAGTARKNYCAVGSVKTNIGHLAGAAGVVSLIKAVLALENRLIPPSLHFQQPSPEIDFANSPFFVNAKLTEWKTDGAPRRAGVSSFGVGGTNVHVILEEAPDGRGDSRIAPARPDQLLLLSAKTETALDAAASNLAAHLKQHADLNLADVAYTLQTGRSAFSHRRMLVGNDLQQVVDRLESRDPQFVFSEAPQVQQRPVVFAFTGQGAQYADMALGLYQTEPVFRKWVDTCAEALRPHLRLDLRDLLYPKPGSVASNARDDLNQTACTQPALFVVEYALAQLWMSWGVRPRAMIGHSIGEYVAACLAGVFSLEDALMLVAARGRLMQSLPAGAMLAVFLPEKETLALLNADLSLAAVNGPSLCVVSGLAAAIEALQQRLDRQGVDYRPLVTSHAFHSAMMAPILEEFTQTARRVKLSAPKIPYISNVSGDWIKESEATDPAYWASHLRQTVRFSAGIRRLMKDPVAFLEVGPGDTLTRLVRSHLGRDDLQVAFSSVRHPQNRQPDHEFLLTALGQLWLAGVDIDWRGFHDKEKRRRIPLPTYPFERQRYWIEAGAQPAEAAPQATGALYKKTDIAHWFYTPVWKSALPPRPFNPDGYAGGWLLFVDPYGLGESIAAQLRDAGQRVVTVNAGDGFEKSGEGTFTIDMRRREDYERLLSEAAPLPGRIVHLWSLTAEQPGFEPAQERGFYSVLFLAQALAAQVAESTQLWVVSNHAQKIESADALYPEQATLLGLCRVVAQEVPNLTCRHLDVALQNDLGDLLLAEIGADLPDPLAAYRGRQRWAQTFEPSPLNADSLPLKVLRSNGVYLVTGGLSGIGLSLAKYLAKTVRARLVLSEQGETEDARAKAVRALEGLGAQVFILGADLTDEAQTEAAIAEAVARFGPIRGVIHAAGVMSETAFEFLQKIDPAVCKQHFAKKVYGLFTLEKIFHGQALDFCLLASSLSTVVGGVGYAVFAAADSCLDAFALERGWVSVDWDAWQLDEETELAGVMSNDLAQLALTTAEVGRVFQRVLDAGTASRIVVSTADLTARIKRESSVAASLSQGKPGQALQRHARPQLPTPYEAPRNKTEQTVAELWQQILGFELVGIHDNFFELGGHSLLITQVLNDIRRTFKVELPLRSVFEHATVAGIAQLIESGKGQAVKGDEKPIAGRIQSAFPTERLGLLEDYLAGKIVLALNISPEQLPENGDLTGVDLEKIAPDLMVNLKQDFQIQVFIQEIPRLTSLSAFAKFVKTELERQADLTRLATDKPLSAYTLLSYRKHALGQSPSGPIPVRTKNPPMVFIHSSPRAGSTLLRIMLAGHPGLFSPPEPNLLYFDTMQEWQQNLGFGDDLNWTGQGLEWAFVELMGFDSEKSRKYIDQLVGKNETIANVYRQLQELAGSRLLLDKTPTYSLDPETLWRAESIFESPKYVYLVRHPYAVIDSFLRIRLDKLFGPNMFEEADVDPYVVAETVWAQSNRNLLRFLERVEPERQYLVRFEEMVKDPRAIMTGLCQFLGIPFDEAVLNPYDGRRERMTGGLGDPNIFLHKQIDPALGEAWKKIRLPRLLDESTVEVATRLGYSLPRETEARSSGGQAALLANLDKLSAEEVSAMLANLLAEETDSNE